MARLKALGVLILLVVLAAWVINAYMVVKTSSRIYSDPSAIPPVEAVIVPGASVFRSGKLSPVLRQRMEGAIRYLSTHKNAKLILSGHAIPHGYNETVPMLEFARRNAIPPENILLDEKGRSTYVTMLNCRRNYSFRRVLIVSQEYHLPRALYIAQGLGFDACGLVVTETETSIPFREYLVRFKDFILLRISKYFNAD
jgi:SanA protein